MAAKLNFLAQVDAWVKSSQARSDAVLRESSQRLFDQAQTPGPSVANPSGGGGGRMPVDTGFLRASFAISFDGMPTGPSRNEGKQAHSYDDGQIALQLAGVKFGQTIFAGWTAEYAPFAEERYGFCRAAAQNWQQIVSSTITDAKARFP